MNLLNKKRLETFIKHREGHEDHAVVERAVRRWIAGVEKADWRTAEDIRRAAPTADFTCAPSAVGFRVGGAYLIRAAIDVDAGEVDVLWIGRASVPRAA